MSKAFVASNFIVAQKFPHVAVNLVGAGLDDGVHDGAVAAAEFRAVGIGFDLKLRDGIHRRLHHISGAVQNVAQIRVIVNAVEQEVVLQGAGAVGAEAICGFDARPGFGGSHTSAEKCELSIVASVQRQRVDAVAVDQLAEVRGFGFELRSLAGDLHCFCRGARLKLHIHANTILHIYLYRSGNSLLESVLFNGDLVAADPERAGNILANSIGGEGQASTTIDVGDRHLGTCHDRAAWVAHQSHNGSRIFLPPHRRD